MADAPSFCVDDSVVSQLSADALEAIAALEPLLLLGESAVHRKGGPPEVFEGIYDLQLNANGRVFSDFLYQEILATDRDFARRMAILLDRCARFEAAAPAASVVTVNGASANVTSYACRRVRDQQATGTHYYALLQTFMPGVSGAGDISIKDTVVGVFLVGAVEGFVAAYRRFITEATRDEGEFFNVQEEAFPHLLFHPSATFNRMSQRYSALIATVVDHLSFLNDEFVALGKAESWDIHKMTAKARINFSEETGKTRNTERLIAHRRVFFGKTKVECTLHTKIAYNADRIHFHAPHKDVDPRKVIIGVLADHLPTK